MPTQRITAGTQINPTPREVLTASRTYYVRTDGSDINSGLIDSASGAFLTVQAAVDAIANLDTKGYPVTVQVKDGTFTGAVVLKNVVGVRTYSDLVIQGNSGTPTNVVIAVASGDAFLASNLYTVWNIQDCKITAGGSGYCLKADNSIIRFSNINFGASNGVLTAQNSGQILAYGNFAVSGNIGVAFAYAFNQGVIDISSRTITFSNSPAITYVTYAEYLAFIAIYAMTFTNGGTVTGKRYTSNGNAIILTNGGGANYIPGNSAGTTASGGQYL